MATAATQAPDLTQPSWPLRLAAYRGTAFEAAALRSVIADAEKAGDPEYARACQYALDSGDWSDVEFFDAQEAA
ncbi:MAG: hypothetical protein J7496_08715 [Novosphingobium sp.]|nr:hypothetical protein [Novosphingobium sp.]